MKSMRLLSRLADRERRKYEEKIERLMDEAALCRATAQDLQKQLDATRKKLAAAQEDNEEWHWLFSGENDA